VLPEDAVVLLVQAHDLRNHVRVAVVVGECRVEVADFAQAVASVDERGGEPPQPVFAAVEVVDPGARRMRVSVRYDHLRDRRPVDDGSVEIAQLVEDQTFAGVEADAEPPVLPAHLLPVDLETGAFRLGDLEGLESVTVGSVIPGGEVAVLVRDRERAVVVEPDDVPGDDVHQGQQALDRVGPRAVPLF
jgi:hypothetical protein